MHKVVLLAAALTLGPLTLGVTSAAVAEDERPQEYYRIPDSPLTAQPRAQYQPQAIYQSPTAPAQAQGVSPNPNPNPNPNVQDPIDPNMNPRNVKNPNAR